VTGPGLLEPGGGAAVRADEQSLIEPGVSEAGPSEQSVGLSAEASGSAGALHIPAPSLVVLVGVSGSGKSTFAARHFARTEVLSSDFFRGLVADDENDQRASADAFELLYWVAAKRLARRRLTVLDATNVHPDVRAEAVALAAEHGLPAVAIVLDLPLRVCRDRNAARPGRALDARVLSQQRAALRRGLPGISAEGFHTVHLLTTAEQLDTARVVRTPLPGGQSRAVKP
jgi:protein phosphatase